MPQQMLIYRAAAFWARVYAPELSMGLMTAEEAEDIIDLEPSAYREVSPAKGRARSRAAVQADDTATIDAGETQAADTIEDEPRLDATQVAALLTLVTEAGADIAKVCKWAGVTAFSEIPASSFERVRKALEAKLRQAQQSTSAAEPPPAAETPAAPPAGEPASSEPPLDDAGPSQADLKQEAYEAGRAACENGVDFKDIPEKYRNHAYQRKAWKDGYQEFAAEAGA
jgi:hypothetical protein